MSNKILSRIIATIFLFIIGYLLFAHMLPLVIANPQDYLFSVNSGIFVYGIFCFGIGVEIKSLIDDYKVWKYMEEEGK